MNWYHTEKGAHTHVRVFMNGAKCGDLTFRNEEFKMLPHEPIKFLPDTGTDSVIRELLSRPPSPLLANAFPVILYFATAKEADDFTEMVKQANPNLTEKPL